MKIAPSSPAVRPQGTDALVTSVARRLTSRDRMICHILWEHRVLTTAHITDLAFNSPITAQHRLTALDRLRVLDRFRRYRPVGSDPYHYVLDEVGTEIVAADRGLELPRRSARRARALALADSQRLAHLLGVNGVFCALAREGRADPTVEPVVWWSERRCADEWGELVRPDGYGELGHGRQFAHFLLEYDRGTETLDRLASKLDGYAELALATESTPLVAFWFLSHRREAEARRILRSSTVRVVTGAESFGPGPGGASWLPIDSEGPRVRLADLGSEPDKGGRV